MKRVLRRPSPAMVIALVAMFAALGGTAIGAKVLTKKQVKKIANNQITKRAPGLSVASAKTADSAKAADTAKAADNLSSQRKLSYQAGAGTDPQVIFDNGNLKLTATCAAGPALTLTANTAVDNASIQSYGNGADTNDTDFDIAESPTLSASNEERDVVYTTPGGQVIVIQYAAAETGPSACFVKGVLQIL